MIARLACHVIPHSGVVFLALPLRCVQAVNEEKFAEFLEIFCLRNLLPPKKTPKIVFYTLCSEIGDLYSSRRWKEVIQLATERADPEVVRYFTNVDSGSPYFQLQMPKIK